MLEITKKKAQKDDAVGEWKQMKKCPLFVYEKKLK